MSKREKVGIVLFNLGGPLSPDSVGPFLRNLFSDPAIIRLPAFLRLPIAWAAARRRAPEARLIYEKMGGASPLLANTRTQAAALEGKMRERGWRARVVIAMRYWHPFAGEALGDLLEWGAERLLLLPLYPHYSTTTTGSAMRGWRDACRQRGASLPTKRVCCYPEASGFVAAHAALLREALEKVPSSLPPPVLFFSAHGLPRRIALGGDPYVRQIERSAEAIAGAAELERLGVRWKVTYQSRVGPVKWIEPYTDTEIALAAREGKPILLSPISFVSDHAETLVEMDRDYRDLALLSGAPFYGRVPSLGAHPAFMDALIALAEGALGGETCSIEPFSPCGRFCGFREEG